MQLFDTAAQPAEEHRSYTTLWDTTLDPARPLLQQRANALATLHHPEVIGRLSEGAMEPVGAAPEAWDPYLRRELEKWGGVIRARGIRVG